MIKGGEFMRSTIASILKVIGATIAASATVGCVLLFWDEPAMPKSMLEK